MSPHMIDMGRQTIPAFQDENGMPLEFKRVPNEKQDDGKFQGQPK